MQEKSTPAKSSVQFGVLFGVIMILQLIVSYVLNIGSENKLYSIIVNSMNFVILPFTLIYMACSNYKKNSNNGFISFGECIKIGLSVAFLATIIYGVFYFIFNIIFPEFIPELIDKMRSITIKENPNLTNEQLEISMSMIEKVMKPYFAVPLAIAMNCFIALIHSLIIGAIVKKDANQSF